LKMLWSRVLKNVLCCKMRKINFLIVSRTIKKVLFIGCPALLLLGSCMREELVNMVNEQESQIEKYVETLDDVEVAVDDGVWRVVMDGGSNNYSAVAGDSVSFNYSAYIFRSGKGSLFDTNIRSVAKEAKLDLDLSAFTPRKRRIGRGELIKGLDKGLLGVRKGDRCYIIFSSKYGYGNKQIGMIPKMSPLIYEVWILDVNKN